MRTLLLIFVCERPKYANTGGKGSKPVKFCGCSLCMDAPHLCNVQQGSVCQVLKSVEAFIQNNNDFFIKVIRSYMLFLNIKIKYTVLLNINNKIFLFI